MKVSKIGNADIIMSNPHSKYNYFAWPTVARLQDGKIAVTASGFRMRHICPFGKTVISYSFDDGESFTAPAPIIDTVLDDRDGGIVPFGEKNVIVTSFNNTVAFQRKLKNLADDGIVSDDLVSTGYDTSFLDYITQEEEQAALGVNFRLSNDYGITFGEIFKSPVSSPHGPVELRDGSLLWVGHVFDPNAEDDLDKNHIQAHKINTDGSTAFMGEIEKVEIDGILPLFSEPHAIALDDGTILAHFRAQNGKARIFTILQSKSTDNGKTWTKPKQILANDGGAPPHLLRHSSGMLICTYGYRSKAPYGIKAMFSRDNGETWDTDHILYGGGTTADIGYPSTVELQDGSLLTVFYAKPVKGGPAVIMKQRWRFEDEI